MNTKCFYITLTIWFCAVAVPVGFAEILPETYQSRATQTNMDETATLGANITRGLYERCLAAQVAPLSFAVANKIGWYLIPSVMQSLDDKATNALMQWYVNPDTVYEGTTNIAMLTVAGLWAKLDIGDGVSQFTGTPAMGTNPPTYGDYPWRIYKESLQERHDVIQAQQKTASTASRAWVEVWQGEGKSSSSYSEAYDEAVDNYGLKSKGYSYSGTLMQVCKATFWSNASVQGGSGLSNGTGEDGTLQTHTEHHDTWVNGLDVAAVSGGGKLVVACSGISSNVHHYSTNLIVTGSTTPDFTGTYYPEDYTPPTLFWLHGAGHQIYYTPGSPGNLLPSSYGLWTNTIEGVQGSYFPNPVWGGEGIAYVAITNIHTITTNPAAPVDYSGDYFPVTNNIWRGGPGYIFVSNGSYIIYSSLTLDTNEAYLTHDTKLGDYSAVNFTVTSALVTEDAGYSPPCVGHYTGTGAGGPFSMDSWSCVVEEGGSRIFFTNDSPNTTWSKDGGANGVYSGSGTGVYGNVEAAFTWGAAWDEEVPTMVTPSYTDGTNVVTVFYQCWLTKVVCSNDVFTSTNIEHRAGYWVKPTLPNAGANNYWDNQDLGLSSDVWNERDVSGWSSTTNNPTLFGGPVDTVPEDTAEPTVVNTPSCTGFKCAEFEAVVEWKFKYCTE